MPRANRHYLAGHAWHLTHRCHKKEHLLKFGLDRDRYLKWLFEAKKRFGLSVLNYMITSNHVHLLVMDTGSNVISRSIQLIAGRTAQEYNQRKGRVGAFWEDRYHATAVQTKGHMLKCMVYIDLNMIRAGAVSHPSEWPQSGYNEIINPPKRYVLIDHRKLMNLLDMSGQKHLSEHYGRWIEEALDRSQNVRDSMWTESLAVGDEPFVQEVRRSLANRAIGRECKGQHGGVFELREPEIPYSTVFDPEKPDLSLENTCVWDISL
jgi:putative transposase